jgi:hypothetical protein
MSYYLIEKALTKSYVDLATGIPTAYTSVDFDPESADQFIDITMLAGEFTAEDKTGFGEESGIYQISIYTRSGVGTKTAYQLADIIRANYIHGLELTSGAQKLMIQRTSRNVRGNQDGWFIIDLSVYYTADFSD